MTKSLPAYVMMAFLWSVTLDASDPKLPETSVEVPSVVISVIEQVEVPARQQGPLVSLEVEEGDSVAPASRLARIDDGDALLAHAQAELNLETARAEANNTTKKQVATKLLELAESELTRGLKSRQLFANAITDEEIQYRQLMVDKAKLEIEQAEHETNQALLRVRSHENDVRTAQRQLDRCSIVAPLAGVIMQINRRVGEWVDPGQPVLRIVRIDRLRAEGFVQAPQLATIAVGQPVSLRVESPELSSQDFTGVLKFISPEINPVDGRVRVWAEVDNARLVLRPGMRARMIIHTGSVTPARSSE